ncbi:MAG: hypothetical protein KatS3mg105_0165 [Gemmatales bacterium]|nr:MAG: hypothetical protein KatS3mg105_0165 [Gemmatales bacterium]
MLVSCLCVCHNKPDLIPEAIDSIVNQTYPHWEAIIVDSGVLFDQGYYGQFDWRHDPRIRLLRSEETETIRREKAMAPWCFNQCFRKGLVRGDLVVYLCDDDILYPNAFEVFVSFFRQHPEAMAAYASQDIGMIEADGWHSLFGERRATELAGTFCQGRGLFRQVDYLQFCHRMEVLEWFDGSEFWPESKATERFADGIFMEYIGSKTPIYPIDIKVSQNRRTWQSLNFPLESFRSVFLPNDLDEADRADAATCVTVHVVSQDHSDELEQLLDLLAEQTHRNLDILVSQVGQSDRGSGLASRFSHCRFLMHEQLKDVWRAGVQEARGQYYLNLPATMLPCADMVECLLLAKRRWPGCAAIGGRLYDATLTPIERGVIGLFDVASLKQIGGYHGDWETFRQLANRGYAVERLGDYLAFRVAPPHSFDNDDRRRLLRTARLLAQQRRNMLHSFHDYQRRIEAIQSENCELRGRLQARRYRAADWVHACCTWLPGLQPLLKTLMHLVGFRKKVVTATVSHKTIGGIQSRSDRRPVL